MASYLIVGYYGNANFGDEVMLESLLETIGIENHFIVTGGNYTCNYKNVDYFLLHSILADQTHSKVKRFLLIYQELSKIIKKCDEVIVGGGTLVKNNLTTNIVLLTIAVLCKLHHNNLQFISIGIEKLNYYNYLLSRFIFSLSAKIQVRDTFSLSHISGATFIEDLAIQKFKKLKINNSSEALIVAPAFFPNDNIDVKAAQYINFLKTLNQKIVLVSSQNLNESSDFQLCQIIARTLNCELFQFKNMKSLENFPYHGNIISERYHIGILSYFINSQLLLIGNSKKIQTLARSLKVNCYNDITTLELQFKKPYIQGIL